MPDIELCSHHVPTSARSSSVYFLLIHNIHFRSRWQTFEIAQRKYVSLIRDGET